MTLLNRILAEKRTFVTVVGAILVVDIALYALAIYPWLTKVSQSESRTSTAESQIEQVRTAFSAATTVSDNTLLADNELERFYREILPRDLAGARLILSPFLDRLAEESDLVLERSSSVPEKESESLLARLRTTMMLAGEYEDIRRFIYAVETAPEFILIEEVILSKGDEAEEALILTLGLSTYYWAGLDVAS
jgi:Tfp pilus assembly protein PilO